MLYIVRHGETDWNREKRFQAGTDVPLNENGRRQAQALSALFRARGLRFALARCSPLGRAVETMQIVLQGSGVEGRPEPVLRELSLGDFEGRREAEIRAERGEAFDTWRARQFVDAAPGGESLADGIARVAPVLEPICAAAADADVLLVGHQAINMAIKAALSGLREPAAVAAFKQANDEVDVWDVRTQRLVERLRVE